ncbi:uncharacterized protein LOC117125811 [Brassica rapa]|nr:uncharacterized protein LOC117125811 [Brassica rapa]
MDIGAVSSYERTTMSAISMIDTTSTRDEVVSRKLSSPVYKQKEASPVLNHTTIENLISFYWRFFIFLILMADNLRRALQDIDLGINDAPFVLPTEVVRQAEEENRFILIGRPVMPRRQNLRAIVATMPRNWGFEGTVRGRMIEGRRFQFVFPSEEALDTVIRRGPWAFADRMLVLQRWTPLMDLALLNFIPFWIQVRGIPFQYMNREVILHIARSMNQQYIQMEYNEENGQRLEFVRIRLNWNIAHPLRFQRNYQFTVGVNTVLRFQYERLRGFCEVCGMLTHDSGACIINNGGPGNEGDDDDSSDDGEGDIPIPNQGVLIEEIEEEDEQGGGDDAVEGNQEAYENVAAMEEEEDDDDLGTNNVQRTLNSVDGSSEDMCNLSDTIGLKEQATPTLKRKMWLFDTTGQTSMFNKREKGETSQGSKAQRVEETPTSDDTEPATDGNKVMGGAVGPEPPLPP